MVRISCRAFELHLKPLILDVPYPNVERPEVFVLEDVERVTNTSPVERTPGNLDPQVLETRQRDVFDRGPDFADKAMRSA